MKTKFILLFTAVFLMISPLSKGQFLKELKKITDKSAVTYTESEAADAIKEALIKGTSEGVKILSKVDGYFGNPEIKIPFPPDAKEADTKLRALGLGSQVDEAILSLNRAAEDAATEAKPIFTAAARNMSIKDAIGIVKGTDNAATQYLIKTTSSELNAKFRPVIEASLDKVDATKYWEDLITVYNKIPFVKKINPDLADYVTGKAIDGLFVMVAKEELKIRKDPVARTSELLKKVFGNATGK